MMAPRASAPNELYRASLVQWPGPELPSSLTGVDARIIVMTGYNFPRAATRWGHVLHCHGGREGGSYGPARRPGPSTGNLGIGPVDAFQKRYDAVVVMPDGMSPERTQRIRQYGSDIVFTPGTEMTCSRPSKRPRRWARRSDSFVLAQFEDTANYRFHYHVTGNAILDRVDGEIGLRPRRSAGTRRRGPHQGQAPGLSGRARSPCSAPPRSTAARATTASRASATKWPRPS